MVDLSTFLLTLAGISTAVDAIMGGFVINGDREAVRTRERLYDGRIREVEREKQNVADDMKTYRALIYVCRHLDILLDGETPAELLRVEDGESDTTYREEDDYLEYWQKAAVLYGEYFRDGKTEGMSDYSLLMLLKRRFFGDTFSHFAVRMIYCGLVKRNEGGDGPASRDRPLIKGEDVPFFMDRIRECEHAAACLDGKLQDLDDAEARLSGFFTRYRGLLIFGLSALFCVVAPLAVSLVGIEGDSACLACEIAFLTVFSVSLAVIFGYMVYLARYGSSDGDVTPRRNRRGKTDGGRSQG